MAFFAMLELTADRNVTVFRNPDRREWRELEEANDPLDGVRGFVVGPDFYAWAPAALHGELDGPLAASLGGSRPDRIPVTVLTLVGEVAVTGSLVAGRSERRRLEAVIRACANLRRRLGSRFRVRFARLLEEAA